MLRICITTLLILAGQSHEFLFEIPLLHHILSSLHSTNPQLVLLHILIQNWKESARLLRLNIYHVIIVYKKMLVKIVMNPFWNSFGVYEFGLIHNFENPEISNSYNNFLWFNTKSIDICYTLKVVHLSF